MASAASGSAFRRFLNSETGPRTVHFWAPVFKWSLVIAGLSDSQRPVETLSGTQQIALFATGVIWTRWCLIIKPKNYLLASVNAFLGIVAGYQLSRIYNYQSKLGYSPLDNFKAIVKGRSEDLENKQKESKQIIEAISEINPGEISPVNK